MTISYQWLSSYLPEPVDPERLSHILTSIGLEVESMERKESIPGGLEGLVIGEVLETQPHPNADKLKLTVVHIGEAEPLSIVCGAPNVAAGQKVVIAPIGATIYPTGAEPVKMKKAKIRGVESNGMICAEDEIGLGHQHDGIMVLPASAIPGTKASDFFQISSDWVIEIGLTPNRMDAMSHLGVARDVIAYLNYHDHKDLTPLSPLGQKPTIEPTANPFSIKIENKEACQRYAGMLIEGIVVKESPEWLKKRLQHIGLKPINNVVDVTNFILHETGQPLHAFDANAIKGNQIIVRVAKPGETILTLDEKERILNAEDLLICHEDAPMCIAGVFGGKESGVSVNTTRLFLESAWFHPKSIRKTSFRHQLRTDAAARFEKGVDIGNTLAVLNRAALIIQEVAGGNIIGEPIDLFPEPPAKKEIGLTYDYLHRISGKKYAASSVKKILTALGFAVAQESDEGLTIVAPTSKPDMHHPVDIVEEIMRIDGLDHVEIPAHVTYAPAGEKEHPTSVYRHKANQFLTGVGFLEILSNSITNEKWYSEDQLQHSVKLLNNLSADHNILRPSMIESGLECIAFNLHRKNLSLQLFEFGKTYLQPETGRFQEAMHLSLYVTGHTADHWQNKRKPFDFFYIKGICFTLLEQLGISNGLSSEYNGQHLTVRYHQKPILEIQKVSATLLKKFDIRQEVFAADFFWDQCAKAAQKAPWQLKEIVRFPIVERDLSVVINKKVTYRQVEQVIQNLGIKKLKTLSLFDVFEHERFGPDNKSMALHVEFLDTEKTLTDKETDQMMQQLIVGLETSLNAEIRK